MTGFRVHTARAVHAAADAIVLLLLLFPNNILYRRVSGSCFTGEEHRVLYDDNNHIGVSRKNKSECIIEHRGTESIIVYIIRHDIRIVPGFPPVSSPFSRAIITAANVNAVVCQYIYILLRL